ncbi:MAG: ferredoxin-type protein NapF [Rhodocyclaceae bacterium]|nr:ferredoxin-type protein NapF [Rhodocyclaceae bacterium]
MQPDRRRFLRARLPAREPARRPPNALREDRFTARCDGCGACLTACPTRIIDLRDGLAELDFSRGECRLCGDCVRVCTPGALVAGDIVRSDLRARVSASCLAVRGVECRICGDHCEAGAIRFRPVPGGIRLPDIAAEACTGCGACFSPCPEAAILIQPITECCA